MSGLALILGTTSLVVLTSTCRDTAAPASETPSLPAPSGDLTFTVNTGRRHAISRLIYGMNFATESTPWAGATPPREVTLNRMGGNRLSAYNWETNYSNAGSDYHFQNDQYLSASTVPGEAVRSRAAATFAAWAACMATIPMLPYVAGDACGCNVGTTDADRAQRLATHFTRNQAAKGAPFSPTPDVRDGVVAQDEFVAWVTRTFPGAVGDSTKPLLFSLDNEPDAWHATHKEVMSD